MRLEVELDELWRSVLTFYKKTLVETKGHEDLDQELHVIFTKV